MLSDAVTLNIPTPPALTPFSTMVISEGTEIIGDTPSYSITFIEKLPVPTFPAASDAVHVTVVVPIWNVAPDSAEHVGPTVTAKLSEALTENVVVEFVEPCSRLIVISAGTVMTGAVVSRLVVTANVDFIPFYNENSAFLAALLRSKLSLLFIFKIIGCEQYL